MQCQICKNNPAGIKIAHVINDKKIEMNLCKSCAEKKGLNNPMTSLPQFFGNFIAELLGEEIFQRTQITSSGKRCSGCGSTWDDFQATGMLGCDICYQVFREDLNGMLRRLHGSNQHIGSRPGSKRKTVDLDDVIVIKEDLKKAIENENFELAAKLRDMVRDAERQISTRHENDGILR